MSSNVNRHSERFMSSFDQLVLALKPIVWASLWLLGVLWLSRLGLAIWQWERISQTDAWLLLCLAALRFDGVLLGMVWAIPLTVLPLSLLQQRVRAAWARLIQVWSGLVFVLVLFMELASPAFIAQYDARPNFLFVEYLHNVQEVGQTLIKAYPWHLLLTALILPTLNWGFWRFAHSPASHQTVAQPITIARLTWAVGVSALLFSVTVLMARGALGHRPANPAMAAVTADHWVNEWAMPSIYTVAYAMYQNARNENGGVAYGSLHQDRAVALVRETMGMPMEAFTNPNKPLWHQRSPRLTRQRPMNLVIVLEESLGAEFVGRLGGLPLTPNLDRLADEGIWFEQIYATGTRSVRGIEAVIAGFPPTSVEAVVKQPKAQRDFVTVASVLKAHGYDTRFFYGGESHFDNMRGFFLNNGCSQVLDQNAMSNAAFVGTWGASDGDVFNAAHEVMAKAPKDRPFMSLIFTSSNHSPFEFPEGQIALYEQPKGTVNNAVKYADHALGAFIAKAKTADYWRDTLFLVIADHNSRVYGDSDFPVERFHIPALLLGGPVQAPQKVPMLASQLDILPTVMGVMGIQTQTPWMGRDLLDPTLSNRLAGRAIMQFDQSQAYREGDAMVVLFPGAAPKTLHLERGRWVRGPEVPGLVDKALAHALYAKWAYAKGWHQH
jgi:phosphoglycerol transferase MdoB-like AlkP superfamily enzyme